MNIAATGQDSNALDTDLNQLAQDIDRLHNTARHIDSDADRDQFARLEHNVNWRLNMLAYVIAAQDGAATSFAQ